MPLNTPILWVDNQSPTTAGAVTGVLDVSAFPSEFTLEIEVSALGSGKTIQLALEDTNNATAFSDANTIWTKKIHGPFTAETPMRISLTQRDIVTNKIGVTNGKLRLFLVRTDATPGLTLNAWAR